MPQQAVSPIGSSRINYAVYWLKGLRGLARGAESRTWARGQLKYDGFPVL